MKAKVDEAFKCAVEEAKDNTPVQYVLAAAFLAKFLEINPEKATIEKLSIIVERNRCLQSSLSSLEDSVRR